MKLHRLYQGSVWAEGPAWLAAGYLVWSDIPNDRMLRWDEATGAVSIFRQPAGYSNGNTADREGRLVTCEHGNRRVTRTSHDGAITVLAERYQGKRLNSPNDVVVASDGAVWFTDPTYGIDSDREGHRAESEIRANNVYRLDPSGELRIVADDFEQPNGLAFSLDEKRLYVSDSGATHRKGGPQHLRVFDVDAGRLSGGAVFARCEDGLFDGLRVDATDLVWTSAGKEVHCYDPGGSLLRRIPVGEPVANVAFGAKRNRLFICASTSLYAVDL